MSHGSEATLSLDSMLEGILYVIREEQEEQQHGILIKSNSFQKN